MFMKQYKNINSIRNVKQQQQQQQQQQEQQHGTRISLPSHKTRSGFNRFIIYT